MCRWVAVAEQERIKRNKKIIMAIETASSMIELLDEDEEVGVIVSMKLLIVFKKCE
jgi:hypothetical protein